MVAKREGISPPNYSQIPNDILGNLEPGEVVQPGIMAYLTESELKVMLAVCRMTFGYHQSERRASITMIQEFTGLSRQSVISAATELVRAGLIEKSTYRSVTVWAVVVQNLDRTGLNFGLEESKIWTRRVKNLDQKSLKFRPPSKKERKKPRKESLEKNLGGGGGDFDELKKLYQSEFGSITPNVLSILTADFQTWGLGSLREAIDVAVSNDKRVWSYVRGILRRQAEARQDELPLMDELPEPAQLSDIETLWLTVKQTLRMQTTQATYDAHIAQSELRRDNGNYVVVAANSQSLEWLRNRLHDVVVNSLRRVSGEPGIKVDFVSQAQSEPGSG